MATAEETKKAIVEAPKTRSLKDMIEESAKELGRALPEHLRPERIVRIALTLIRQNPELTRCTQESFLGALFTAAQLGIEPIAGQAYILPFNNSRKKEDGTWHTVKEAQFILGYKGLVSLFFRHDKAIQLSWGVVHEKDEFDYQYGTDAYLHHRPVKGDRGEVEAYYVVAGLANGGKTFEIMTKQECLEHGKKHSKTFDKKSSEFYKNSPWFTNEEAMCLKTVLIQVGKLLPLSVEIQRAISADETSREFRKGVVDVLSEPSNTEWNEELLAVEDKKDK